MSPFIDELVKVTQAISPLPPAALEAFTGIFSPFDCGRRTPITRAGSKERYLYFVTSGVQRVFEADESGEETTILFTYPFSFGGILDAFMLQQPSRFHYEALTDSAFLRTSFAALETQRSKHPSIEQMLTRGLSLSLSGVLERLSEIQRLSAEEKLRRLMQRSPQVFELVPQKYLASYLGIDPTNLSKFLNKVRL